MKPLQAAVGNDIANHHKGIQDKHRDLSSEDAQMMSKKS